MELITPSSALNVYRSPVKEVIDNYLPDDLHKYHYLIHGDSFEDSSSDSDNDILKIPQYNIYLNKIGHVTLLIYALKCNARGPTGP